MIKSLFLTALSASLLLVEDANAARHIIDWSTPDRDGAPVSLDPIRGAVRLADSGRTARVARIEIPAGERVTGVQLVDMTETSIDARAASRADVDIQPGAPDGSTAGYDYWILPDGFFRGHRIAHVLVATTRETEDGAFALTRFTLDVTTAPASDAPVKRRIEHPRTREADARVLRKALDTEPLPYAAPDPSTARDVPPEIGTETVEYLVITSEAISTAFNEFVLLKTQEGMPAKVTTIEWILDNYDGIDLAQRMRHYITDVYRYQGLRYVMLAGDTDVVPQRITINRYQAPNGAQLTSEIYFAALDGDYNADGDEKLGEGTDLPEELGDEADLYHEIAVARMPASDITEALTWLAKWKSYTGYDQAHFRTDYQDDVLSLGEVLFPDSWEPTDDPSEIALDGADLCEMVLGYLGGFNATRMYQYNTNPEHPGAVPLLKADVVDEINAGYGIIDHVGHGFRTNMSVGDDKLLNADADAFSNDNAFSVLYAANCNSGAVAYDSISEHLMLNPSGGIIGGISSTDLDYPYAADDFKYRWFEDVFTGEPARLADAFYDANLPAIPVAILGDNSIRWTVMALIAQGDPALDIWRGTPQTMDVAYDNTYEIGSPSMTVTVTDAGSPVEGAVACLYQADGSYGVAVTNGSGVAEVPFLTSQTGFFTLTVTKNTYVPKKLGGNVVAPVSAAVRVESLVFHDGTAGGGSGNADNRPDAGENVVVDLVVKNYGAVSASGLNVVMHPNSPYVVMSDSTTAVATTSAGQQRTVVGAFAFDVIAGLPDSLRHARIPAEFEITSLQGNWDDELAFSVYQRILQVTGLSYSLVNDDGDGALESGESVSIDLTVQNRGEGTAVNVTGVASVGGPFLMTTDTINFGTIAPGAEVTQGALEVLSTGGTESLLSLSLVFSDTYSGGLLSRQIDIVAPPAPTAIETDPRETSIRLFWPRPAPDVRGYRVFRSVSEGGPYTDVGNDIIEGGAFYSDEDLPALTQFFYKVAAVDSSGNEGAMSDAISASTSPAFATGWPVPLPSGLSQGSPTIFDLDDDGQNEVILGWNHPIVVRGDGTEYIDGDSNAITLGIFSTAGGDDTSYWISPPADDIDGDGLNEAVFCTFENATNGQMFVIDETGAVEPGWPRTIGRLGWSSPAIGDVDGVPGKEIFVSSGSNTGTYQGVLFGFHHDGSEIIDGDNNASTHGVFRKGPAGAQYMYTSVALGPVSTGGGAGRDIVFVEKYKHSEPSLSRVFLMTGSGAVVGGFPYDAGGQLRGTTSSPAVADINGDGSLDIVVVTEDRVDVVQYNGTSAQNWPKLIPEIPDMQTGIKDFMSSPAVGDIDLDGDLDIVLGWLEGLVYAWDGPSGTLLPGFPYDAGLSGGLAFNRYVRSPILGNVDGDPNPEIIVSTGDAALLGINHDGTPVAGFPLQLDGIAFGSAALGDANGDGNVNLVVQTDAPSIEVYDFANVPYVATEHPWPMFRHNAQKDGTFRTPSLVDTEEVDATPAAAAVHAPFPNPFTAHRVDVPFDVPGEGRDVVIRVFDVNGREVRRLADGHFPGGRFRIQWDGRGPTGQPLAPGIYFTRIEIGAEQFVRKLTMLR